MMSTTMTSAAYLMNVAATIQPPPVLLTGGSRVSSSNSSKPLLGLMPLQLLRRNYRNTEHIVSQPRHDEEHKKGRSPEGPRPDAGADSGGEFTFPSSASGRHSPALPHLVGFPHQNSIEKAAGLFLLHEGPPLWRILPPEIAEAHPPHDPRRLPVAVRARFTRIPKVH